MCFICWRMLITSGSTNQSTVCTRTLLSFVRSNKAKSSTYRNFKFPLFTLIYEKVSPSVRKWLNSLKFEYVVNYDEARFVILVSYLKSNFQKQVFEAANEDSRIPFSIRNKLR